MESSVISSSQNLLNSRRSARPWKLSRKVSRPLKCQSSKQSPLQIVSSFNDYTLSKFANTQVRLSFFDTSSFFANLVRASRYQPIVKASYSLDSIAKIIILSRFLFSIFPLKRENVFLHQHHHHLPPTKPTDDWRIINLKGLIIRQTTIPPL